MTVIVTRNKSARTIVCDLWPVNGVHVAQMWIITHQDSTIENVGERVESE